MVHHRPEVARLSSIVLALLLVVVACAAPTQAPPVLTAPERERYATDARWAPGQLEVHFQKHPEGYRSLDEYDRGARETIRRGTPFTYRDREANETRLGFYEREDKRFTALTRDGRRITTHFRPDRGEEYIRRLEDSTYR